MLSRNRLIVILSAIVVFSSLLAWVAFHPHVSVKFFDNRLTITILLILGIAPIYPLIRTLKKRSHLSALAIVFLVLGVLLGLSYLAGDLILHINAKWVFTISILSNVLIIAGCLLLLLNGFVRRNRQ